MRWRDSQHGVTVHLGVSKQLEEIHKISGFDENFWFGGYRISKSLRTAGGEGRGFMTERLWNSMKPKTGYPSCNFVQNVDLSISAVGKVILWFFKRDYKRMRFWNYLYFTNKILSKCYFNNSACLCVESSGFKQIRHWLFICPKFIQFVWNIFFEILHFLSLIA